MIYFSELRGKTVFSEDKIIIGTLEDIIFQASETPLVSKIVVRGKLKDKLIIPIKYLYNFGSEIIIGKDYDVVELEQNELHLVKNLLDKQIIDLKGNKVVRVNDVAIQDKAGLYVAGVDIGILGILRWFRLEKPIYKFLAVFGIKLSSEFLSWGDIQPLELMHGEVKLRKKEEKLKRIRPEDLADYLEKTNIVNVGKFLRILDERKAAEVLEHLNLNYRASFFRHYNVDKSARLLALIDPDDAVDILLTLPAKKRQQVIELLPSEKKSQYNHLLKFSDTQVGSLLTTEYLTVGPNDHVKEVLKKIRLETKEFYLLNTIYVLNEKKELIGVFNLHELLLQEDPETPVYKFMIQDVLVTHLTTPAEIVLSKMIKYRLTAFPVIDDNKNLLGIVAISDLIQLFLHKII